MKLFLVRHGETEENLAGLLMGQDHGVLTEKGKEQAKETALKLKEYKFTHIFSSDLNRCVDTSLFIKEFYPETPLTFTPQLRERHLGVFQGKHHGSVDWESLPGGEYDKKPEGGESISELKTRVLDFVKKLYDQYPNETILCISHNAWIKQIVAHYMNTGSLELPKINNAQIIEVEVEDGLGGRIVSM